jgi:hypothetical protein
MRFPLVLIEEKQLLGNIKPVCFPVNMTYQWTRDVPVYETRKIIRR